MNELHRNGISEGTWSRGHTAFQSPSARRQLQPRAHQQI